MSMTTTTTIPSATAPRYKLFNLLYFTVDTVDMVYTVDTVRVTKTPSVRQQC